MEKKWTHAALPALLIHLCVGTIYCWSTFKAAMAEAIGVSSLSVGWAFSLAIFFLGLAAACAGPLVERDVRLCSLASCLCFTIGLAGTGLSVHYLTGRLALGFVCFFYGAVMGAGLGVGYLVPVKTLMLWFRENPGLGAGIAISGFGLSKVLFTPLLGALLSRLGISGMFYVLALISFALMLPGHLLLRAPDAEPQPDPIAAKWALNLRSLPQFVGIWLVFFLNTHCGLMVIPYEKQLLSIAFSASASAATVVSVVPCLTALCNVLGRLGCAALSDRVEERSGLYKLLFVCGVAVTMVAYLTHAISGAETLPLATVLLLFLFVVNACYGGGFAVLPVLLSERFGLERISQLHGLFLTAWALAGLTGNNSSAFILRRTGMYENVLLVCAALYAVALLICSVLVGTRAQQCVSMAASGQSRQDNSKAS